MSNSDRPKSPKQQNRATNLESPPSRILPVKWSYRWDVFRRLQALDIECQCSTNEPLLVSLYSPTTAIQIWSVLRQFNASRCELIDWLDHCWEEPGDRRISE